MKHLEHGNIAPVYGVSTTVANLCLVSPWYENGNIMEYLKKNPDVSRFTLVSTLEQLVLHPQSLLAPTNSCLVWPTDCASCIATCWSMAP